MLKLYEVLGSNDPTSRLPLFCPTAVKTRLALINKGIQFETQFVTYHDLRFIWKQKLGVAHATTPFIQDVDGTYIMDSEAINAYLDKTYPNAPSPYSPTGVLPIDIESAAYKASKEDFAEFATVCNGFRGHVFTLCAATLPVIQFNKEGPENDFDYWTSEARLGSGTWARINAASVSDTIESAKKGVEALNVILLKNPDAKFFSSNLVPGNQDSMLYGIVRLLKAVSVEYTQAVFGEGPIGGWLKNLEEYYAKELADISARDPK